MKFDDTILRHTYTRQYGIATGLLNVYTIYGTYQLADTKVPPGIALTPQGFKRYNIKELLTKNPELLCPEALGAAEVQKW
jgi:hypothetical protein